MAKRENPFMHYVGDYEKEAEAFLTKYECSEAIDTPMPIPIRDIATRLMSLDIIETECLSFDGSVHGVITFSGGIIDVYDWNNEETVGYEVSKPSIFIDADISNVGRINNTLAHECFHWWRHRNYFNFKRTHENGTEFAFRCNKYLSTTGSLIGGQWSNIDKMEWQAKTIAPKILMPKKAFKKKVDDTYKRFLSNCDKQTATPFVIDSIADFFEVSKQSAAIRMCELGYSEAQAYCDLDIKRNLQNQHRNTSKAQYHRKPITAEKAFELYLNNDLLKSTLDTGAFVFVDGYFVLNDSKYVVYDNGQSKLSSYANSHLAECTLDFSVKLIPDSFMHSSSQMMYRSDSVFKQEPSFDSNTQNTELYNKAKEFEKKLARAQADAITPAAWMKKRMAEEHWNEVIFESKTLLDKMNYSRVTKGTHKFSMRPLVAMGVGLNLDLSEMEEVLKHGGMAFTKGNKEQEAFKFLFTSFHNCSIEECNDFLKKIDIAPLGTIQKK